MLTSERKALILQRLGQDGRLVARSFAGELALSEDTIRRDLREMAAEGLLARVIGGHWVWSPAMQQLARDEKIDLTVVGPEAPLHAARIEIRDLPRFELRFGVIEFRLAHRQRRQLRAIEAHRTRHLREHPGLRVRDVDEAGARPQPHRDVAGDQLAAIERGRAHRLGDQAHAGVAVGPARRPAQLAEGVERQLDGALRGRRGAAVDVELDLGPAPRVAGAAAGVGAVAGAREVPAAAILAAGRAGRSAARAGSRCRPRTARPRA